MNFVKAKNVSDVLYVLCGVCIVGGVVIFSDFTVLKYCLIAAAVIFGLSGLQIYMKYCRCPYCDTMLPRSHGPFCDHCEKRMMTFVEEQQAKEDAERIAAGMDPKKRKKSKKKDKS